MKLREQSNETTVIEIIKKRTSETLCTNRPDIRLDPIQPEAEFLQVAKSYVTMSESVTKETQEFTLTPVGT